MVEVRDRAMIQRRLKALRETQASMRKRRNNLNKLITAQQNLIARLKKTGYQAQKQQRYLSYLKRRRAKYKALIEIGDRWVEKLEARIGGKKSEHRQKATILVGQAH